jgi:hypothetical protein
MTQLLDYVLAAAKEAACIIIRDRTWLNSTLVCADAVKTATAFRIGAIESDKGRVLAADGFLRRDNRARHDHHGTDQLDQRTQQALVARAQLCRAGQKGIDERPVKGRSTNSPTNDRCCLTS